MLDDKPGSACYEDAALVKDYTKAIFQQRCMQGQYSNKSIEYYRHREEEREKEREEERHHLEEKYQIVW